MANFEVNAHLFRLGDSTEFLRRGKYFAARLSDSCVTELLASVTPTGGLVSAAQEALSGEFGVGFDWPHTALLIDDALAHLVFFGGWQTVPLCTYQSSITTQRYEKAEQHRTQHFKCYKALDLLWEAAAAYNTTFQCVDEVDDALLVPVADSLSFSKLRDHLKRCIESVPQEWASTEFIEPTIEEWNTVHRSLYPEQYHAQVIVS